MRLQSLESRQLLAAEIGFDAVCADDVQEETAAIVAFSTEELRASQFNLPHVDVSAPVVDYTFQETGGTAVGDSAGSDNPATLFGTASFVQDAVRGRVVSLRTASDMAKINSPVDLGEQWTITSWFNGLADGTWKTLTRGARGDHQILVDVNGQLGAYDNVGGTGFRDSGFNMNSLGPGWHHVAAVGASGRTTYYVNGRAVGLINEQSISDVYAVGNFQRGSQRFADALDDFRIYDQALTAAQVAELANVAPQAPIAGDDQYEVLSGSTLTVPSSGVLVNDADANGDALTVALQSGPSQGESFTLNPNGSFSYVPASGFMGTDSFTYVASDGVLSSEVATVTITVQGISVPKAVVRYGFEELSGVAVSDFAGGDNPATLYRTASFAQDAARGRVLALSGNSDMARVNSPVDLGDQWTISSWFHGLADGTWKTLSRGAGGDHQILVNVNGQLGAYDNAGGRGFRDSGFNMNSLASGWHHVAAVGSGGRTTFYVDGQAVGSINVQSTSDVYAIGNYQRGGQRFADALDDFRIYDQALSAAQVAELAKFNQPKLGKSTAIAISLSNTLVSEAGGVVDGTLTRMGDVSSPMTVNLASDLPSLVSVPAEVTFAAGVDSVSFQVAAIDNSSLDGRQLVSISASASGLDPVSDTLRVTDDEGIQFAVNYTDAVGEGFFENGVGQLRQDAFEWSIDILSGMFARGYAGETIVVDAAMDPLGGRVLGQAGPTTIHRDFGGNALANTWYVAPLANHLAGRDLNGTQAEISATFSSDANWYYGTDGKPTGGYDFVSVILHEVGHGLGFMDLINQDGSYLAGGLPGIYDRFLELGDGTNLVAMTQAQRQSAMTSNDLYWSGAAGTVGNGDVRPRLYAPGTFKSGSSTSHLDEGTHGPELMTPFLSAVRHEFENLEQGMLSDMGWNVPAVDNFFSQLS